MAPGNLARLLAATLLATAARGQPAPLSSWEVGIPTVRGGGASARAVALLLNGVEGGSIAVSAIVVPAAAVEGRIRAALVVDIEGTTLLAGQTSGRVPVEVVAYAVAGNTVSAAWLQTFTLDAEAAGDALQGKGIKVVGTLELPASPQSVRVLVRNPMTLAFGLVKLPFLPVTGEGGPRLLGPPVFADADEDWILAAERGTPVDGVLSPLGLGGAALPATRPVLAKATTHGATLAAVGPPPERLSARVLAAGGTIVGPADVVVDPSAQRGADGITRLHLAITLPEIPDGGYTLELAADEGPPVDVRFLAVAAAQQERVTWVSLHQGATAPVQGGELHFSHQKARLQPASSLRDGFREALSRCTDGSTAPVAAYEEGALAGQTVAEFERLQGAELQVVKQLVRGEPEAGIALLVMYGKLHDDYRARRSLLAQAHAARQVEALAPVVGHRGLPPIRSLAAAAAAVVGADLDRMGNASAAERILRHVLLVDPMCPAALSGMALITERTGRYGDTAMLLDRLVSAQPDNAEARLRLAVNLEREGLSGRAVEELRACAGPGSPQWVRAVAYQELVHAMVAAQRFREALAMLDEAEAALPGDRGIAILRALVLEHTGGRPAAAALVARLGSVEIEEGSPRLRYCQPPEKEVASARAAVAAAMPRALEALARGLAAHRSERHQ